MNEAMAVAVSNVSLPSPFRSHTFDYESMASSTSQSDFQFGRYQDRESGDNHSAMRESTLSLEAIAALLIPLPDNGEISPPARSRGFNAYRDNHSTQRKSLSFPTISPAHRSPSQPPQKRPPVHRSRSVRFADTQGLPLERIRPLTSADPFQTEGEIVPSLISDLGKVTLSARPAQVITSAIEKPLAPKRVLKFPQPGTQPDFYQRLQNMKVCLESVQSERRALHGIVRTLNLSYEKHVSVRWTHDNWISYHDTTCIYCPGSSDGNTDRFSFTIPVNGDDIQFGIRYQSQECEYWDSNNSQNYLVTVKK